MDCWENVFRYQHDVPIYLIFVLFLGLFLVLIGLIVLAKRSGASVRYFMPTMLLFVCFRLITILLWSAEDFNPGTSHSTCCPHTCEYNRIAVCIFVTGSTVLIQQWIALLESARSSMKFISGLLERACWGINIFSYLLYIALMASYVGDSNNTLCTDRETWRYNLSVMYLTVIHYIVALFFACLFIPLQKVTRSAARGRLRTLCLVYSFCYLLKGFFYSYRFISGKECSNAFVWYLGCYIVPECIPILIQCKHEYFRIKHMEYEVSDRDILKGLFLDEPSNGESTESGRLQPSQSISTSGHAG